MTLKQWLLELSEGEGWEAWFGALPGGDADELLFDAWAAAHVHAELAYDRWRVAGGGDAYAVYRAAADREDAAQEALRAAAPRT
jgi:hypothetical protein